MAKPTLHTAGSWAEDTSGSVTVTLPTHSTGDMLIVRVGYKSSAIATCLASTATGGWGKVGEFHNGTTNSGNGTGSVGVAAFWKVATSGAETNPTIDFSQTQTQAVVVALSYTIGSGDTAWNTPVGDGGGDTTAGTSHSATIQSHVSITANDLVDFFSVQCDDTTQTVPTFTQTGATLDAVVESPATAGSFTGGADAAGDGGYRTVASGTSSAAAVVTGTLSTSETGSSWTTRLRSFAADPQSVTPTTASLTTSSFAPSVTTSNNQRVTPTTLALATGTFAPTVTASANQLVTPTTASLATSTFAPTVSTPRLVTPATVSLSTATFEPTVSASAGTVVVPATASLTTAGSAPTVSTPRLATPVGVALVLSTFAPTVTATAHQTVTPGTLALSLATFAPTVTGGAGLTVTPTTAELSLSTFAPTVSLSDNQLVTPDTAALVLASFAASVIAPQSVTPATAALSLAGFAPNVQVSSPGDVQPLTASLILTTYRPMVLTAYRGVQASLVSSGSLSGSIASSGAPLRIDLTDTD